jgi:DNA-binding LacI/PurR family transcriptional regulator
LADPTTIRDVAKHAGVGVGTVSRVLNDRDAVSEGTRRKVLAAIRELDYSPSPVARRLSGGKAMAIGVIVPFFTNASVVKRLQGVTAVLASSEYDLVLFDVERAENRDRLLSGVVQRKMVDALLIISLQPAASDMARFLEADLPAVVIDGHHPNLPSVFVDNVEGGRQATQHLLALGHRRIAYISDPRSNPFNYSPTTDRYEGYRQALSEAGAPCRDEFYREGKLSEETARVLAHELLALPERPTAVFAYSDTQAIGVLTAARERGLRVPADLSVVGFDDIETAEYMQLTTVRQSLYESGVRGAELLLEVMSDSTTASRHLQLPTELVIRQTTAPPP